MISATPHRRPFSTFLIAAVLSGALVTSGCYGGRGRYRGGDGALAFLGAAIITAAIVSAVAPPPPRVVYVPPPRPGWAWQPGYWSREGDEWLWMEGRWIQLPPHYTWAPTHWEEAPDRTWHLIPGRWVPTGP
jgi:hypothetical protein